jgi:hypothetical protein
LPYLSENWTLTMYRKVAIECHSKVAFNELAKMRWCTILAFSITLKHSTRKPRKTLNIFQKSLIFKTRSIPDFTQIRASTCTPLILASTQFYHMKHSVDYSPIPTHKHEKVDIIKWETILNITTWTDHNDCPIKKSHLLLLAPLEGIVSWTYLHTQIEFHNIVYRSF